MLLVGWHEGHPACKKLVGCWHDYLSRQGADLRMAQLMPLPLTITAPVNPDWFYLSGAVESHFNVLSGDAGFSTL